MSSCSTNSANLSGVHLSMSRCGTELRDSRAKIFPPTLKQRSSPHCRFSVAWEKERQKRRMDSTLIGRSHLKRLRKNQQVTLRVCDFFDVVKNRGCKQNS